MDLSRLKTVGVAVLYLEKKRTIRREIDYIARQILSIDRELCRLLSVFGSYGEFEVDAWFISAQRLEKGDVRCSGSAHHYVYIKTTTQKVD